jgi:hypothetical protein
MAFKEWAVVCRALASGRQDVILRKGGIVEPGGEFRVEQPESLISEARDLLLDIDADRPPEGTVVFRHVATVRAARRVQRLEELAAYRPRHVWSDAVVAERFHRWKDELHVLEVEVNALSAPLSVPWHGDYGGCRSWVELRDDVAGFVA